MRPMGLGLRWGLWALAVLVAGAGIARGAPLTADGGRLVVADTAAERLFVYSVPDLNLLATFEGIRLGGDPVTLYASVTGELYAFPLADVLAGRATAPTATTPIGRGTHGPVIAHGLSRLALTTLAGLEVVDFSGASLGRHRVLPWEASGRSGGRNARPRLAYDGRRVYGAVWPPLPPEQWAERRNDIHVANAVYLFDVRPDAETFQRVVAKIPLPPLRTDAPIPGQSPAGRGSGSGAITPDGRWAFVSHGGEGTVSVIDTAARRIVRTLTVPTALRGGGYMVAMQPGARLVDTVGR